MKTRGQTIFHATIAIILTCPSWAQQNPGLSSKPSGRSIDDTTPRAEQPVDLTRPSPQQALPSSSLPGEELYLEAALRGEAWAQTKLGKIYIADTSSQARQTEGMQLLQKAAAQNEAEAIYVLAMLAVGGAGPGQSDAATLEQMKRAAELGFADAQFALGRMYLEGRGTAPDPAAALASFRRAAEGGNKEAMFSAARMMLSQPEPEMRSEGLALMERAIKDGHIEATLMLATAYGRGANGMPKDELKAEALLKPAAERGDADCQMALASLYKFGESFAARRDEANEWLQRAADQGHPKALEILQSEPPGN